LVEARTIEQKKARETSPLYISHPTNTNNNTIVSVMANGGPFGVAATPPKAKKKEGRVLVLLLLHRRRW
jgi:hypothetical protein